MLQNVIRKTVRLAKSGTKVEVKCWTEIREIEGFLFFSVTLTGDHISNEDRVAMFEQSGKGSMKAYQ